MNLHKVQIEALGRAKGEPGFGFLMEQGLGKSLTSLAEMCELAAEGDATRFVVLCPNSFKSGWVEEVEKWDVPLTPFIYNSGATLNNKMFLRKSFDKPPLLIVNFEAIRSAATQEYILEFIKDKKCAIYADESIQISTYNSNQTKAAVYLAKHFDYRRILSGKWMKQGPHDTWSQLRFIGKLDGMNYFSFRNAFCKMGGFKGKAVVGAINEERLAGIIDPCVFFALKKDWTDLPPKIYTHRDYKMEGEQLQAFNSMLHEFITFVGDEAVTADQAITKYIKLAQIQAGFIINEAGEVKLLVSDDKNPRLNAVIDMIENEAQGKVIVPYHHRHSRGLLERGLAKYRPSFIAGGMQPEEIVDAKRSFNTDPNCRVICLQTRASKYGHTLLGDQTIDDLACRTMAFFENTYSLDDRSQIEDRMHRHGQLAESVLYVDFVGSIIDRNMTEALQRKESIYQAVMRFIARSGVSGR